MALIFVEVALVNGVADNVQKLLDESKPAAEAEEADTAIFYSISNAQTGLAGVSFGEFLIKRVVSELQVQLPKLQTFATLSPIPGFAAWLTSACQEGRAAEGVLVGGSGRLAIAGSIGEGVRLLLGGWCLLQRSLR